MDAPKTAAWQLTSAWLASSVFATVREKFVNSGAALFRTQRLRLAGVLLYEFRMGRQPLARTPQ